MDSFWINKRVLVTGGTGFIGSYLVEMLVQKGAQVTVPTRQAPKAIQESNSKRVSSVQADLLNEADAIRAIRGQQVVVHLAGHTGGVQYISQHPAIIFTINMRMFMNLIGAAKVEGVERFLVVSTACVYSKDCNQPVSETDGFVGLPDPAHEGYAWEKRMEEFLASAYHREFGLNVCTARVFNVYGPNDDFTVGSAGVIPSLIRKTMSAKDKVAIWGDGSQTRSFIYVRDCARGLLEVCAKARANEVFNIGSDEEITIADLARTIMSLCGKSLELTFNPSKPSAQARRQCDTRQAKQRLGFEAEVPLRQGLKETFEWYISEHHGRHPTLVG